MRDWRKGETDGKGGAGGEEKWKGNRLTPVFQYNDH